MKLHLRSLLLVAAMLCMPAISFAQVSVSITLAPPILPVYAQPICPGDGYMWTPGYWAYGPYGYYWVPGTWVLAPIVGYLWTPGYWGWGGGYYAWHAGYWGPHVGFYGGVNYGYGYGGSGYAGGRWNNGVFNYNRSVNNINGINIHNTYNETVINNASGSRVSFNGGNGGTRAQPTARDLAAAHDRHIAATGLQMQHQQAARADRSLRASVNHGHPAIAATPRPGAFNDRGAVRAKGAPARQQLPSSGYAPHGNAQGRASQGRQESRQVAPQQQRPMNEPRRPVENAPPRQAPAREAAPSRPAAPPAEHRVAPSQPQPQRGGREPERR